MYDWCVTLSMQYLHKQFNMVRINIENKNVENALTKQITCAICDVKKSIILTIVTEILHGIDLGPYRGLGSNP